MPLKHTWPALIWAAVALFAATGAIQAAINGSYATAPGATVALLAAIGMAAKSWIRAEHKTYGPPPTLEEKETP